MRSNNVVSPLIPDIPLLLLLLLLLFPVVVSLQGN